APVVVAREGSVPAPAQDLRLLDPVLAADATTRAQLRVDARDVDGRPERNLGVAAHPLCKEELLDLGVDAADPLQVVARGRCGRTDRDGRWGWRGRRRFRRRSEGEGRTLGDAR